MRTARRGGQWSERPSSGGARAGSSWWCCGRRSRTGPGSGAEWPWRWRRRRSRRGWGRAFNGEPPVAPPRLEPDLLEQLAADRWYDTQRLRALGFSPRFPSAVEGLQQLALESRSKGLLPAPAAAV